MAIKDLFFRIPANYRGKEESGQNSPPLLSVESDKKNTLWQHSEAVRLAFSDADSNSSNTELYWRPRQFLYEAASTNHSVRTRLFLHSAPRPCFDRIVCDFPGFLKAFLEEFYSVNLEKKTYRFTNELKRSLQDLKSFFCTWLFVLWRNFFLGI